MPKLLRLVLKKYLIFLYANCSTCRNEYCTCDGKQYIEHFFHLSNSY